MTTAEELDAALAPRPMRAEPDPEPERLRKSRSVADAKAREAAAEAARAELTPGVLVLRVLDRAEQIRTSTADESCVIPSERYRAWCAHNNLPISERTARELDRTYAPNTLTTPEAKRAASTPEERERCLTAALGEVLRQHPDFVGGTMSIRRALDSRSIEPTEAPIEAWIAREVMIEAQDGEIDGLSLAQWISRTLRGPSGAPRQPTAWV